MDSLKRISVVDSHTGGEPTRVIVDGGPDLGKGPLHSRARMLQDQHQSFYRSILLEPRGQIAMVGALLVPPTDPRCVVGVIFFDLEAVLGMCGHGTIGLATTLVHLGRIGTGEHKFETPVGVVDVLVIDANTITVTNVESKRSMQAVSLKIDGYGQITGDVAFGGNWFFISEPSPISISPTEIRALLEASMAIRDALCANGITGSNGEYIDHVVLIETNGEDREVARRNFVLCPDHTYDRSPCGTGCSAYLACLAADGVLPEHQEIEIQSIIGSSYKLSYRRNEHGGVVPKITGTAYVISEASLIFSPKDPFILGIDL